MTCDRWLKIWKQWRKMILNVSLRNERENVTLHPAMLVTRHRQASKVINDITSFNHSMGRTFGLKENLNRNQRRENSSRVLYFLLFIESNFSLSYDKNQLLPIFIRAEKYFLILTKLSTTRDDIKAARVWCAKLSRNERPNILKIRIQNRSFSREHEYRTPFV